MVDIKFPREAMPKVYEALKLDASTKPMPATPKPVLRLKFSSRSATAWCVPLPLGSSDGLRRGMSVKQYRQPPFRFPFGMGTLGRIMDVLGRPIDEAGPIDSL